jgi:Cu/Ag efflux pump CusA
MHRRRPKAVVRVEALGAVMQRVHQQRAHAGITREGQRTFDGVLQQGRRRLKRRITRRAFPLHHSAVAMILGGLLPNPFGGGTGNEVANRLAAPTIRGTVSPPLLLMFVEPAERLLTRRRGDRALSVRKGAGTIA